LTLNYRIALTIVNTDFIVGIGEKKIVIEVGINKTEYKQILKTAKKLILHTISLFLRKPVSWNIIKKAIRLKFH
jgi:hypothetical protein